MSTTFYLFEPLPEDGPRQRRPDIAVAESKLGWKPKVGLEEELQRTIEYFVGIMR